MTCVCGEPILHAALIQSIRDGRIPFEVYHWPCPSCSTLMEELRLGVDSIHQMPSTMAYPVRPVCTIKKPTGLELCE